jgi:hypothetical protein
MHRHVPHFLAHDADAQTLLGIKNGEPASVDGPAQELYEDQAYPAAAIGFAEQQADAAAASVVGKRPGGKKTNWQEVGPDGVDASGLVASESTAGTANTIFSGRTTAIALSPGCNPSDCQIYLGTAGGGVWRADNALAPQPNWKPSSAGIASNAIGSLIVDPTDRSGRTLYAGTGEPNGSADSEAGLGLYRSTDAGKSWSLVPGSLAVAHDRSIAAVAVDPADSQHIFIGTAVARHGSSSVNGGRFTPPGAPTVGLYESTDGGQTFNLVLSQSSDVVIPGSSTGGDFFRGGISHIELYRASGETQVYASMFDYGVFRRSNSLDGDSNFQLVFGSGGSGSAASSSVSRTEFSLAPNGANLRVYVGDSGANGVANFYRTDNANVPAAALYGGGSNAGWTKLSNPVKGTPGYASYNYCSGQCTYDMPVYSPSGSPDIVYIGGAMQYAEIGGPSNGRAEQRSEDAGVHFTDMTLGVQNSVSQHPDQHAIVAAPFDPNIVFFANDGGVFRIDGTFSDASGQCAGRGLTGANLVDCQMWLSKVPNAVLSMNRGLGTLQYQSISVNVLSPFDDLLGGTQDNGTQALDGKGNGFITIFGDGGQSGIDVGNPNVRVHTFFSTQADINFHGNAPLGWDWIADPWFASGEAASFYIPLIADPAVSGTWFSGLQHVFRTQDDAGGQAYLDQHCNEFTGDFAVQCGDWVTVGQDLSGAAFGASKGGTTPAANYVVALSRAPGDANTLWAATRRGRVFVSSNGDAAAASVTFTRIDTAAQPTRFVSGIAVDPSDSNHAFVSYSGYNAYAAAAGTATGHVFEVHYNPTTHTAIWSADLAGGDPSTGGLGDQPVTGIAVDWQTGDVYVSTDFGVDVRKAGGTTWQPAAGSLPSVAVYGLTVDVSARILYAATHGRGIWSLNLGS